ncbi:DUF2796 domain-containing protein [Marinobacter sp.]|uniref:ZrgA family zinc uptake protein n=1 Tax=Marinobacter sp. TaxID=50741 RepID=UPI00384D600B
MKHITALCSSYLLLAVTLYSFPALAADNPAAHSHGEAGMQVAIEGHTLDLMFQSPAYNLIGFEHEPKNDRQRQAVRDAREWLESRPLVDTETPSCRVREASITDSFGKGDAHDHHAGHKEHDDEAENKHHGHHDDHQSETHSEFSVIQTLHCDGLADSRTLTAPLMDHFPAIEALRLEWVSSVSQGSARLEPGDTDFRISQ